MVMSGKKNRDLFYIFECDRTQKHPQILSIGRKLIRGIEGHRLKN